MIFVVLASISFAAQAQFGVSYHLLHSNLSLSYQINDKFIPEVRISTNQLLESLDLEAAFSYIFYHDNLVDTYVGAGISTESNTYLMVPFGLNIYPFEKKNFGFLLEVSPMLGESAYLRGDIGIRYRFMNVAKEDD